MFAEKEGCGSIALVQPLLPDCSSGERFCITTCTLLPALDVVCCFATVSSRSYRAITHLGSCGVCPYVRSLLSSGLRKETVNRAVFVAQKPRTLSFADVEYVSRPLNAMRLSTTLTIYWSPWLTRQSTGQRRTGPTRMSLPSRRYTNGCRCVVIDRGMRSWC